MNTFYRILGVSVYFNIYTGRIVTEVVPCYWGMALRIYPPSTVR